MSKVAKNNRKFKRFALKCARYRSENRQEKNKVRNLRQHLRCHSTDRQAVAAFKALAAYH